MLAEKLKKEIEVLPEEVLQEIEDFIKTLKTKKDVIVQPPRHEGTKKNKNIMKTGKYWQNIIIY